MLNNIKSNKRMISIGLITFILISGMSLHALAQLSGFQSAFYQNQYLANPAVAGMEKGLNLNLGYQRQWTTVAGSPKLQNLTADYNYGERVGLGLLVNNDQAGLISRTRVMATYAYHLPLNEKSKLNFGLSLGLNDTYIDYSKIVGDQGDVAPQDFNQRRTYVDGDFGISYTRQGLNVQAALPNLKSVFFNKEADNLSVDRSTFYSAIGYKVVINDSQSNFSFEPKIAFRGVKGFDNIVDAGVKLDMLDYNINMMGMYHTNQSFTLGFGVDLPTLGLMFAYSNNTGAVRTYANNTFEFGLKFKLLTE